MKTTLQNFFKSKKNKIFAGAVFAVVLIAGGGIYASNRANKVKQLAKQEQKSAEEQAKKEQEEKEKIELAKAEEKKKAEELEKEKLKAEEEKAKVEQQKAEVDKRERDNFVENKSNSTKKETQKNSNLTSKKTENSKKNKKKDNNDNNNNNNDNKFEVEEDENTYSKIGNTGKFFSTRTEATAWAKSQVANENSVYWKNGYKSWWVGQCKHNGKIGWTVSFIK